MDFAFYATPDSHLDTRTTPPRRCSSEACPRRVALPRRSGRTTAMSVGDRPRCGQGGGDLVRRLPGPRCENYTELTARRGAARHLTTNHIALQPGHPPLPTPHNCKPYNATRPSTHYYLQSLSFKGGAAPKGPKGTVVDRALERHLASTSKVSVAEWHSIG